ncbi:MAG: DUF3883 domain-containing protein [Candidatus Cloacimonetes bacterium]|nr:DUF3883 domain-containing protein [Candidatus Cloacimonadota bacterium]
MNNNLKIIIIKNEQKLLKFFPEYKKSIDQYIIKLKSAKYDKTLYDLIIRSFASKDKSIQELQYNKRGFKSSRQIAIERINEFDFNDYLDLDKIEEEKEYTSLEICSLAGNYNNQVGMYFIKESNSVIIKSTVEDNDRPYNDRWIKKDIVLKYCMQAEKDINLNSLVFSYKPNAAIFNSLMDGKLIKVYSFVNNKRGTPFIYKGVYHPCGLIDDNRAFLLFKHGFDNEIPYDNLDTQFLMTLIKTGRCPQINCELVLKDKCQKIVSESGDTICTSKRNILQQKKINLEVSIRGEELVLKYEKKKLMDKGYSELAEEVSNVTYSNMNLGYDIHSFDINEKGEVVDLFIKVQSLISNNNKPIIFSKEEYINFKNESEKYKLYKIYNIYTIQPRLFILNSIESIIFIPNSYLGRDSCKTRCVS